MSITRVSEAHEAKDHSELSGLLQGVLHLHLVKLPWVTWDSWKLDPSAPSQVPVAPRYTTHVTHEHATKQPAPAGTVTGRRARREASGSERGRRYTPHANADAKGTTSTPHKHVQAA